MILLVQINSAPTPELFLTGRIPIVPVPNLAQVLQSGQDADGQEIQNLNAFRLGPGVDAVTWLFLTSGRCQVQALSIDLNNTCLIINAPAPVSGGDLTNKTYVDGKISGASGSFTTVDGKTVTVVNGLITAIV